jgi:ferredoxin-NADP reductase
VTIAGEFRNWQLATAVAIHEETASVRTIRFTLPQWPGHVGGQHVDVRLTAEDGYQAERSYSIASPAEEPGPMEITVERIADGEVSPFLTEELRVGYTLEIRGPIGGTLPGVQTLQSP